MISPTIFSKYTKLMEVIWQQYRLCLATAEYQILGGKHFVILAPESGKILVVEEGTIPSEEIPLPMGPSAGHATEVDLFS